MWRGGPSNLDMSRSEPKIQHFTLPNNMREATSSCVYCGVGGSRTHMGRKAQRILSPPCIPFHHYPAQNCTNLFPERILFSHE